MGTQNGHNVPFLESASLKKWKRNVMKRIKQFYKFLKRDVQMEGNLLAYKHKLKGKHPHIHAHTHSPTFTQTHPDRQGRSYYETAPLWADKCTDE